MNRDEVLERIQPILNYRVRSVVHEPRTRVQVLPDMVALRPSGGAHLVPFAKEGVTALAQYTGMGGNLIRQLSPDTFGRVATELLARHEQYGLILKGDSIVAFCKRGVYQGLPAERVLHAIERSLKGTDYHRVQVNEGTTEVRLEVVGAQQQPVVRGDLVRAGALINFSPVGTINPMVQSYVVRLTCTNGAMSNDVLAEYHYGGNGGGEGDNIYQWFRDSVRSVGGALSTIVERYHRMRPEAQRAQVLEALLRQAKITGEDAQAVRAMAIERPPRNAYEAMNLITWANSHVLTEPRQITRAQQAAARFSDEAQHSRVCPVCRRQS